MLTEGYECYLSKIEKHYLNYKINHLPKLNGNSNINSPAKNTILSSNVSNNLISKIELNDDFFAENFKLKEVYFKQPIHNLESDLLRLFSLSGRIDSDLQLKIEKTPLIHNFIIEEIPKLKNLNVCLEKIKIMKETQNLIKTNFLNNACKLMLNQNKKQKLITLNEKLEQMFNLKIKFDKLACLDENSNFDQRRNLSELEEDFNLLKHDPLISKLKVFNNFEEEMLIYKRSADTKLLKIIDNGLKDNFRNFFQVLPLSNQETKTANIKNVTEFNLCLKENIRINDMKLFNELNEVLLNFDKNTILMKSAKYNFEECKEELKNYLKVKENKLKFVNLLKFTLTESILDIKEFIFKTLFVHNPFLKANAIIEKCNFMLLQAYTVQNLFAVYSNALKQFFNFLNLEIIEFVKENDNGYNDNLNLKSLEKHIYYEMSKVVEESINSVLADEINDLNLIDFFEKQRKLKILTEEFFFFVEIDKSSVFSRYESGKIRFNLQISYSSLSKKVKKQF